MGKAIVWIVGLILFEIILFAISNLINPDWAKQNAVLLLSASVPGACIVLAIRNRSEVSAWVSGETRSRLVIGENPEWRWVSREIEGETFYLNRMGLIVANPPAASKTVLGVRVQVYCDAEPNLASTRAGQTKVALDPGEQRVFEFGSIVAKKALGTFAHDDIVFRERDIFQAEGNVSRGFHAFSFDWNRDAALDGESGPSNIMRIYTIRVTASDQPTVTVRMSSDTDTLRQLGGEHRSPIGFHLERR